jgi:hypothetical protein
MEPISMLMAYALQNPNAAATVVQKATAPGQVDVQKMTESVADFAIQTLKCYHKTARFQKVDIIGTNWNRQSQYGASGSVGLRIQYQGISGAAYSMEAIMLVKPEQFRTVIASDTALVPYSKQCALENWVAHIPAQ